MPDSAARLIAVLQFAIHLHNRQAGDDDGEWLAWEARVGEVFGLDAAGIESLAGQIAEP
jgi:hypothetical protein